MSIYMYFQEFSQPSWNPNTYDVKCWRNLSNQTMQRSRSVVSAADMHFGKSGKISASYAIYSFTFQCILPWYTHIKIFSNYILWIALAYKVSLVWIAEVRLWFIIVEVCMDLTGNPVEMLSTLKMAARPPWGNNKIATHNSFTNPYLFPFSCTNDRSFKVTLNWSRQVAARHHIKALLFGLYCVSHWQWVSRIFEIGNAFYRSACCTGHKPYITRVMHTSFLLLCLLVINP